MKTLDVKLGRPYEALGHRPLCLSDRGISELELRRALVWVFNYRGWERRYHGVVEESGGTHINFKVLPNGRPDPMGTFTSFPL